MDRLGAGSWAAVFAVGLAVSACGNGAEGGAPDTRPATSAAVTTQAPTTQPLTTQAPTTQAPTTQPPTSQAPTTQAPITQAQPTTEPATTVADWSGVYQFPVNPPDAADYARDHHDYPAADIFAACGTPYVAVTSGRIDETSTVDFWDSDSDDPALRGGLSVTLVGDDGVRYYASHLRAINPGIEAGARVEAGQPLGEVGDTGNAAGTGCHAHFGISPPCGPGDWETRRGKIWPWPYLDSWRDGTHRSPVEEIRTLSC